MNCEYCSKKKTFKEEANKSLISKSLRNAVDIVIEIDRGKLCVWVDNPEYYGTKFPSDGLASKKINYCPMCGKKLGSDKE